eukprot:11131878-Prorocentrum_lima.AAC.1
MVWGADKVTLEDQDGKDIIQTLHFGLPFVDRDDFSGRVRKKQAPSHLPRRHQAPVTPPTINM